MRHWRLLASLAWSGLVAQPGRSLACVLAIAIGVAMGYAIHLINQSAVSEFSHAAAALTGSADLSVRGRLGDSLYAALAKDPAVAAASPVLEVRASLSGRTEPLLLLGVDALRAGALAPQLLGRPQDESADHAGLALLEADSVFLSPAALAWLHLKPGHNLAVQVGAQTIELRIAGSLPNAGVGQRLGVMDIAAAQWRLGRLGELSRVDLRLRPGVEAATLIRRWQGRLPAGASFDTARRAQMRASNVSRAYRVNLSVLGLVALFTGAFLVFSTQVLSVLRRRSQLALLRVLGLGRRGLVGLLLIEGAMLGLAGALLGVMGGLGVANLALTLVGGDLGGGYFNGVTPTLQVEPLATAVFFLLGLFTAIAGSLAPTLDVARARPAAALKAGDEETSLARLRSPWPGMLLALLAAGLLQLGPVSELPIPGYVAIGALLIGTLWLMPWLSARLLGLLPARCLRRPVVGLALTQLKEAPGYAGIGLAGIVASFSLMVAMAIMVASFRDSVSSWIDQLLPAELYVRAAGGGETGFLLPADMAAMQQAPGIARAEFQRALQISLDPNRPAVAVLARSMNAVDPSGRLPLLGISRAVAVGRTPIWVSEAAADIYQLTPGRQTILPLQGRAVPVEVAGIWRDYAHQHGAVVLALADYRRLTGDEHITDAALWLAPGTSSAQAQATLRRLILAPQRLEFAESGQIRRITLDIFDRSFAITYLLEAVAVGVGLLGIGVSFGGQALARLREFGMLRHIGYRRRDIDGLLALEGAVLASLGVLAGLALGVMISRILIDVINPQSFHWTMHTTIPWRMLAGASLSLVALAALTAVLAGRRALSVGAVQAVKEDW